MEIKEILSREEPMVSTKMLESLIGKLTHASYVIPLARHFLYRLRQKLKRMKKQDLPARLKWRLDRYEIGDLKVYDALIDKAHEGISLNGLTLRYPTRIAFSDSCPRGLGGYTHGGRAWRLAVNPELAAYGQDISNNLLEFLAMAINLWLSLIECDDLGLKDELILILGDNTSAIAWLFKSSIHEDSVYKEAVVFIARKVAELMLGSKQFMASQHIEGKFNLIADWLSFQGAERVEND